MPKKLIKIMTILIIFLFVAIVVILGLQQSDFGKIKKYDKSSSSGFASLASKGTDKTRHDRSVSIQKNNVASLGDFNFNIAGGKTLIANISLKYKSTNKSDELFSSEDSIEDEIMAKSVFLRDAAINTMIGNTRATADSKRVRKELKKNLNESLRCGEVEEVYFNKFIIQ